jgi:hypothetical protein
VNFRFSVRSFHQKIIEGNVKRLFVFVSSAKPNAGPNGTPVEWAISQADAQKYHQMFVTHDQKKKGYLTGQNVFLLLFRCSTYCYI